MNTTSSVYAHPPSASRLWAGLLLAPLAWMANGSLGWYISARACSDGNPAWGPLSSGGVHLLVGLLGVVAFVVSVAGASISARSWRQFSADRHVTSVQALDSGEYMAVAGLFVSWIFAAGIVLFTLPAALVGLCVFSR
jgi:hypothetical protein